MFGRTIPTLYKVTAIIGLTVVIFGFGFHKGSIYQIQKNEAARIALQEELFDLSDDIRVKNSEILEMQQRQRELSHALETEALETPGSNSPGIAATGGLQRLERRWGTP